MTAFLVSIVVLLSAASIVAGDEVDLHDLAFLGGCWVGEAASGATNIEEFYTGPSANVILGTTRFLLKGETVSFEFSLIFKDSTGIVLRPYPNGEPSEHDFRLTAIEGERVTFENPAHDFPKRIHYWTEEDGTRVARIDAGSWDAGGREWRLRRTQCP